MINLQELHLAFAQYKKLAREDRLHLLSILVQYRIDQTATLWQQCAADNDSEIAIACCSHLLQQPYCLDSLAALAIAIEELHRRSDKNNQVATLPLLRTSLSQLIPMASDTILRLVLQSVDVPVRCMISQELGRREGDKARHHLLFALSDSSAEVVAAAVLALVKSHQPIEADYLAEAVEHTWHLTQQNSTHFSDGPFFVTVNAYEKYTANADLVRHLRAGTEFIKRLAVMTIGKRHIIEVRPILEAIRLHASSQLLPIIDDVIDSLNRSNGDSD